MSVRVNDQANPKRLGALTRQPVDVQTKGVCIDLDPGAMLGGGLHDSFQIHFIRLAAQNQPAGSVAKHGHARMADRSNDPGCHLFQCLIEMSVDAGHHVVEAR